MSFNRGFLSHRITIWNATHTQSQYGGTTVKYAAEMSVWANFQYVRGSRAMHNGQIDAYHTAMIRCDYNPGITIRSRIEYDGHYYVIDSFNADRNRSECQMTVFEVDDINKTITNE